LDELKDNAQKKGYQVLIQNPYQYSVSHVTIGQELHVFVHIPIFQKQYSLFEFVNIPTPVANKSLYMSVEPKEQFLAIIETSEPQQGFTMTLQQLSLCRYIVFLKTYICPNRPTRLDIHKTCLGSLFSRNMVAVHELCHVSFSREGGAIVPLNHDKVIVATSETSQFFCQGSYPKKLRKQDEAVVVEVPAGCRLHTGIWEYQSLADVSPTPVDLTPALHTDLNASWQLILPEHQDKITQLLSSFKDISLKEVQHMYEQEQEKLTTHYVYGAVALFILILVLLVMVIYCLGYKRLSKKNRVQIINSAPLGRLHELTSPNTN
jgi:hypothetical protein